MRMTHVDKAANLLVVLGGLNWGLVGFFEYNLVDNLFNDNLTRVVYSLVGLAAAWMFYQIVLTMGKK